MPLEEVGTTLVQHWKGRRQPERHGYDPHFVYAHRHCLNTPADVQEAPNSVLFEAMGLDSSPELGWLQFIVRELGWHSMTAANWGHPVLLIPDGVTYNTTTEAQRWAQAATFLREVLGERGVDPLVGLREAARELKARFRERRGRDLGEATFRRWLKRRNQWLFYLYAYGDEPNPPEVLTAPKKPLYTGAMLAEFAGEIRAAAARRRAVWNAPHPEGCLQRERECKECEGKEAERAGVEHVLKSEEVLRRAEDIGIAHNDQLLPHLVRHLEAWTSAEYHIRNAYLKDRLAVFLARNEQARDLLRLPEHRELGLRVKKEVRWLYVPG